MLKVGKDIWLRKHVFTFGFLAKITCPSNPNLESPQMGSTEQE